MSRTYHGSSDDHTEFILIILVAGTVWAHKTAIVRVERTLPVILITMASIISLIMITKFGMKIRRYRHLHSSDMELIDNMTGLEFEHYVAGLLKTQGFTNSRFTEQYDLGVDIIAIKDGIRWGIQVKRYSGLVKAEAVRQVVTALKIYQCDQAMVITNSSFSEIAKRLADSNDCILVDRNKLSRWIIT